MYYYICTATSIIVVLILCILILTKVDKEKYSEDPPRGCGLPRYDRSIYGPGSWPRICDISYPGNGDISGCCPNMDKGLTCQAYQSENNPNKFEAKCTANIPCMSDADCSASKVYNKCAKTGPLKGTCQALDDNGNFMCGNDTNSPLCTTPDGISGFCVAGGCQPIPSCTTPDGKKGVLSCGVCKPKPSA